MRAFWFDRKAQKIGKEILEKSKKICPKKYKSHAIDFGLAMEWAEQDGDLFKCDDLFLID